MFFKVVPVRAKGALLLAEQVFDFAVKRVRPGQIALFQRSLRFANQFREPPETELHAIEKFDALFTWRHRVHGLT